MEKEVFVLSIRKPFIRKVEVEVPTEAPELSMSGSVPVATAKVRLFHDEVLFDNLDDPAEEIDPAYLEILTRAEAENINRRLRNVDHPDIISVGGVKFSCEENCFLSENPVVIRLSSKSDIDWAEEIARSISDALDAKLKKDIQFKIDPPANSNN